MRDTRGCGGRLFRLGYQLTALLPELADRGEHLSWQRARDCGRGAACQHDHRQPVPALGLETGRATVVELGVRFPYDAPRR
ncbi:hypothetical protein [Streptomyces rimosus]|uniref:hypothetical protein n=1 Tax=Streptomyces rimosus TaxID=1927 RepID=UPI0012FF4FC6|nr:hypothetical protein [Streptomyces rimosus]